MKSSPNQLRAITEAQINVALINRSSEKSETVAKTLRQMRIEGKAYGINLAKVEQKTTEMTKITNNLPRYFGELIPNTGAL